MLCRPLNRLFGGFFCLNSYAFNTLKIITTKYNFVRTLLFKPHILNNSYKITVKNENMAAFLNDEVHVTIPDLICCINSQTGTPITNPNYEVGMKVAVVILPAPKEFTGPKGLEIFGPRYAGVNTPYKAAIAN